MGREGRGSELLLRRMLRGLGRGTCECGFCRVWCLEDGEGGQLIEVVVSRGRREGCVMVVSLAVFAHHSKRVVLVPEHPVLVGELMRLTMMGLL